MIKRIIVALASIGLLVFALYTIKNTNFYNSEQLDEARNKAVEQARNGDYESALKRLEVLIKYDKDSEVLWYDYLSVLHWSGNNKEFFKHLDKVNFLDSPDYFYETCNSVIRTLDPATSQENASKLFDKFIESEKFLNSNRLEEMYRSSQSARLDDLLLKRLAIKHPKHSFLQKINLEKMVALSRSEDLDKALLLFEQNFEENKNNKEFLAEYITVQNWARDHEKAIGAFSNISVEELPEYSINALADSFQATGDLDSSIKYYQLLNNKFPDEKYQVKLQELADIKEKQARMEAERLAKEKRERLAAQKQIELKRRKQQEQYKKEQWFKNASFKDINKALIKSPYSQKLFTRWQALAKQQQANTGISPTDFIQNNISGHSENSLLFQDYLVLLSWEKQHAKVIDLFNTSSTEIEGKAYFYEAIAVSARQEKKYMLAFENYDKAIRLSDASKSSNYDLVLGQAIVLQRLNKPVQAIALINNNVTNKSTNLAALQILADAYRQNGDWGKALETNDQILALDPISQRALQNKAYLLLDSNLPFLAYELYTSHSDIFDHDSKVAIYNALNTYNLRLANDDTDPDEQKLAIQKAQMVNQSYIELIEKAPDTKGLLKNAYADRVRLDYLNKDHESVVSAYRVLGADTPEYILNEVSSSLLALRQPHESLEISKYKLTQDPNDFSALNNAYYASLELEDFEAASQYLEVLDKQIPVWFFSNDGKRSIRNPKRESVELLKAMHLAYQNKLDLAQASLLSLLDSAPGNNEYRAHLATIYRWREWFNKSQEQLNIINNSESNYLLKEISQASLYLDQKQLTLANNKINGLITSNTEHDAVKKLNKDWTLHKTNLVTVNGSHANSKGSAFSSEDDKLSLEWTSKPLADHWRLSAFTDINKARYSGNSGDIKRHGAGLNFQNEHGNITGKLINVEDLNNPAFSVDGTWKFSDYFFLHSGLQSFSDETPVRAYNSGVDASSANLGLTYRPSELYQYGLNSNYLDFSDNNKRTTLSAYATQKIFRNQHRRVNFSEFIYWEDNSEDNNRDYYNPESLWSASLAIDYDNILYRFYERDFSHNLRLELGVVSQKNFSVEPVVDLHYSHNWKISEYLSINYGLGYRSTYYDGLHEKGPKFNFGLGYRF